MRISALIAILEDLKTLHGDAEVVITNSGGHLDGVVAVAPVVVKPRVDLHKDHPGHYDNAFYRADRLRNGGYAGWPAFEEPVQSMLTAAPDVSAVVLLAVAP